MSSTVLPFAKGQILTAAELNGIVGEAFGLAAAGTGQSDGTIITQPLSEITSVPGGGACCVLPQGSAGGRYYVINAAATNLPIYPFLGDQIEAYGVNAAVFVSPGGASLFVWNGTIWRAR